VPAADRNDVGLELRGLLEEMLADRASAEGVAVHDAMVMEMLQDFGAPAEIAARYQPPGRPIIAAEQTRWFTTVSLVGVGLQWALTLPAVFKGEDSIAHWWLSWGLGSLWWPGFLVMTVLVSNWVADLRSRVLRGAPRKIDSERVNRKAMSFGLVWFALGAGFMIATPWIFPALPGHMAQVFAYDPTFLADRAPPVLILWLGSFATLVAVLAKGRWTPNLRWLSIACSAGFLALLCWWVNAGNIFLAEATDDGARFGIGIVIAIIGIDLFVQLERKRTRIRVR
jgi:hypothetical protein